jgi:hypothetical protein
LRENQVFRTAGKEKNRQEAFGGGILKGTIEQQFPVRYLRKKFLFAYLRQQV